MKMYQLIEWFQIHFPKMHQDLLLCNHNFDEKALNPYHLESDCWSHTMMVCKIAEFSDYSKVVQIAALLHDIGKPASRKINPNNNHVQFFGHEALSAKMAVAVLEQMKSEKLINEEETQEILKLIEHHAFMHKNEDLSVLVDYFKGDIAFCIHLIELSRCDNLGRFCVDMSSNKKYDDWMEKLKPYHH